MPATMTLTWRGGKVLAGTMVAVAAGVDEVLELAAEAMRQDAPKETGALAGSIQVIEKSSKGGRVGSTGLPDARAFYQEVGTSRMAPTPWLRKNGDTSFPRLPAAISARMP